MMADDPVSHCAAVVMDTFHMVIRTVGPEARKRSTADLSMQQFRAMKTIERHEGASLSQLCEHLGATLSAASKLIDNLVERGYVRRDTAGDDRRKLVLALTESGEQVLNSVQMEAVSFLAGKMALLSPSECAMVNLAMDLLRSTFISQTPLTEDAQSS